MDGYKQRQTVDKRKLLMIEIKKDKKGSTWILTKTDKEGFHRQINLTEEEIVELLEKLKNIEL